MIRLTDKEIEELLGIEFSNSYSGHVAEYLAVRDAQLKKVVEWIEENKVGGFSVGMGVGRQICILEERWQSLLKEIDEKS